MKSEKISQEIAALERKISEAKNKVLKNAFEKKIAELRKELKKEEDGLVKLSSAKKKVRSMEKSEFNSYIKELSKKEGFSFLKSMTKDEIKRDMGRPAKPVGWRFRGDNNKKPSRKDIRENNNVYYEARREHSDVSRSVKLETGGGAGNYVKFMTDQLNYIISLKTLSEKKNVIKNSLLPNLSDYIGNEMDKKITENNLKYALTQKTVGSINKVLKTSINAFKEDKMADGGGVGKNVVIQASGKGETMLWNIIDAESPYSYSTEVFFDSKEEATKYANKKGFNVVKKYEDKYSKGGGTLNLASIKRKYLKNEDENAHSENVVLLAKNFGDAEDLKLAKEILATHNKEGHLSSENGKKRSDLHIKLIEKARKEFNKEGMSFAKGGGVYDELYLEEYNGGWTIRDKKNPKGRYTLMSNKERAEENRKYLIDNPSKLAYYRKNEYAKGGGVDYHKQYDLNEKGNLAATINGKNYEIIYRDDVSQMYDLFENGNKIASDKNLRNLMSFDKYAKGGGIGSGKKYKLRAEGLDDFLAFLRTGMYMKIKSFTVEPIGVPDVVVTFETNSSLSEIKSKLKEVPDSHVMLQTVKPIGEYTGERMEWGGTAESSETGEFIGGENASSMYKDGGEVDINELDMPVIRTQFEEEEFEYENGGSIYSRTKTTPDGKIVGKVEYNDFWKTYQVIIDGTVYEEFKTKEEAINNLKNAGFDKMANGGGIHQSNSLMNHVLNFVSSGYISSRLYEYGYGDINYRDTDKVRSKMIDILNEYGDEEYSISNLNRLIKDAALNYFGKPKNIEFRSVGARYYADGGGVDLNDWDMPVIRTQFEEEDYEYAQGGSIVSTLKNLKEKSTGFFPNIEPNDENSYYLWLTPNSKKVSFVIERRSVYSDVGSGFYVYDKDYNYLGSADSISGFNDVKPIRITKKDLEKVEYAQGGEITKDERKESLKNYPKLKL